MGKGVSSSRSRRDAADRQVYLLVSALRGSKRGGRIPLSSIVKEIRRLRKGDPARKEFIEGFSRESVDRLVLDSLVRLDTKGIIWLEDQSVLVT